jgi:hypothetical protein
MTHYASLLGVPHDFGSAFCSSIRSASSFERWGKLPSTELDPRYGGLREIGVVGIFARTASTFFNAAPHHARLAFIYACLERRTLDECLRAGSWNLKSLHEDIWSGLRTLGYHRRDGRPEGCGEHIYLRGDL